MSGVLDVIRDGVGAPQLNSQLTPLHPIKATPPVVYVPPAPAPTSTGTKVAVGAAAVGATALVTVAVVSAITGWTVQRTLDAGWDKLTGRKKS